MAKKRNRRCPQRSRNYGYRKIALWIAAAGLVTATGIGSLLYYRKGQDRLPNSNSLEQKIDSNEKPVSSPPPLKFKTAEEAFGEFPEEIPGVDRIEKHYTKDAKYCLVHFKQSHITYIPEEFGFIEALRRIKDNNEWKGIASEYGIDKKFEELITGYEGFYSYINNAQKDIYKGLSFLIDDIGLSDVIAEGFTEKDNLSLQRIKEKRSNTLQVILGVGIFAKDKPLLSKGIESENIRYLLGAARLLASERKLNLSPAESSSLLEKARSTLYSKSKIEEQLHQDRENVVLDNTIRNSLPLSVVVYGSEHEFWDNIQKWNREHPNQKFSLIELYPINRKYTQDFPNVVRIFKDFKSYLKKRADDG